MGEKETTMAQYSEERKQVILNKLLSPNLSSIAQLAREENIAEHDLCCQQRRKILGRLCQAA